MNKLFFPSVALAAIIATGSVARADNKPMSNWSGFYIGGNIGYAWADPTHSVGNISPFTITAPLTNPSFSTPNPSGPLNLDGMLGGFQIGWNAQYGNWVVGLETDFQATGQKDNRAVNGGNFVLGTGGGNVIFGSTNSTIEEKRQWLGTLRGRVGSTWNNILIYGTGGLAYGRVKFSGTENIGGTFIGGGGCFGGCSYSGSATFGSSETKLGWTIGFGLEGAAFVSGWTWKAEYLYVDLGSVGGALAYTGSINNPGGTVTPISGSVNHSSDFKDNIVRFGVNYRFGPH
jgi:outer membrane immunogenic protein